MKSGENVLPSKADASSGSVLEPVVTRLRDRLIAELEAAEHSEAFKKASPDQRLKTLSGIFKTLEGVEEMMKRIQQEQELNERRGIDVVEFRRQLEKQIARLVQQESEKPIPGRTRGEGT